MMPAENDLFLMKLQDSRKKIINLHLNYSFYTSMKSRILLYFSLLASVLSFGQTFKYGITANIHKGSIVGIHDVSKPALGGGLGFFTSISLVENDIFDSAWLYLEPQVEFSMQGENADPPQGYQKFHNNYIGTQVYLKYFFHKGNMKRDLFVFAGPRIEILVSEKREGPPVYDMFVDQEKRINHFGYGVSFGAGVKVTQKVEGFIRYDRGFSKIYPDYTYKNTYNRFLGVGINYYLNNNRW